MPSGDFFGFWLAVQDEPTARRAVRMAGLPVLLTGAKAALLSLTEAVGPAPSPLFVAGSAAAALLLALLAFRIRAGHAALLPVAALVFLVPLPAQAIAAIATLDLLPATPISAAAILADCIVPVFCLALTLSGLRGWLWLRANNRHRTL